MLSANNVIAPQNSLSLLIECLLAWMSCALPSAPAHDRARAANLVQAAQCGVRSWEASSGGPRGPRAGPFAITGSGIRGSSERPNCKFRLTSNDLRAWNGDRAPGHRAAAPVRRGLDMLCPQCRFDNPPAMRFCGQCGCKVSGVP